VVVLSAVWFGVVRAIRPDNVRNAAAYAAEHHGVAPLDETLDYKPIPE
jgi:hypothetical protein